jgi:hypothetical protein
MRNADFDHEIHEKHEKEIKLAGYTKENASVSTSALFFRMYFFRVFGVFRGLMNNSS